MKIYEICHGSVIWEAYRSLDENTKGATRKAYRLRLQNAFHPSLHFKCVNRAEDTWSVRVSRGYRAVGVLDADTATWFWIGGHDTYERFIQDCAKARTARKPGIE